MKVTIDGTVIEGTPEEIKEMMDLLKPLLGAEIPAKESEESPKLEIGVKVKALGDGENGDIRKGAIGAIESIFEDVKEDGDPYYIKVEGDSAYDYFRPQDLEKVGDAQPEIGTSVVRKPGEFKKGDIVRNRGKIYEVADGKNKGASGDVGVLMADADSTWRFAHNVELIAPVEARVDEHGA